MPEDARNEKVKDLGYKCLQGSFNSIILDIHWLLIDFMIALVCSNKADSYY